VKVAQFIASRLVSKGNSKDNLSVPFVRISTIAVALSLAVMILSVAIITGFKKEIREKTIGFGSHIQILNLDSNSSFETRPIDSEQDFLPELRAMKSVKHIQVFAIKPGIIKTDNDIQGVVLKGVGNDFDWSFFEKVLLEGDILSVSDSTISNGAIISKTTAKKLQLKLGDKFDMFFVQTPPRVRRFTVNGIFDTQMAEFDKLFVLADIRHIQRLNDWSPTQVTGFEVMINNFDRLDHIALDVEEVVAFKFFEDGSRLRVQNIKEKYPQIFDWLGLQDLNVIILLILMLAVAGINMISGLLIIVLERTNMIGILKALGAENGLIRRIFIIQSGHIILKGLFWGNLAGLSIAFLQLKFGIVKLDEANYYLALVPININLIHILLLNAGTFLVTLTMLLVPSMVISRISPEKTIKFE
jgi:lipoprotein-releasing system permease protein